MRKTQKRSYAAPFNSLDNKVGDAFRLIEINCLAAMDSGRSLATATTN